jgi:Flp pilus assembly pilin Flp
MRKLNRLWRGQGLVEYGLILVLIAVIVAFVVGILGGQLNSLFSLVSSSI